MPHIFNGRTDINKDKNYVYDVAQDVHDRLCPVRFEASREYVASVWAINWADEGKIKARFDREKVRFLAELEKRAHDDYNGIAVLRIG